MSCAISIGSQKKKSYLCGMIIVKRMKRVELTSVAATFEAMRDGYAVYSSDECYEVKSCMGELYVWDTENLCAVGTLSDLIGSVKFVCYTF